MRVAYAQSVIASMVRDYWRLKFRFSSRIIIPRGSYELCIASSELWKRLGCVCHHFSLSSLFSFDIRIIESICPILVELGIYNMPLQINPSWYLQFSVISINMAFVRTYEVGTTL